jgi:hypothetical protein
MTGGGMIWVYRIGPLYFELSAVEGCMVMGYYGA